jgi:hypothetical protein
MTRHPAGLEFAGRRADPMPVEIQVGSSTSGRSGGRAAPAPLGVTAQLAEARARLRAVTPPAAWEAVLAEVQRVRTERSVTLLAAMRLVHDRVAAGWVPYLPR